jgi:hypothetical protein
MARPRKTAAESLALPPDVDQASYKAAVDLDKLFERGTFSRRAFEQKVMDHHTKLFGQIKGKVGRGLPAFELAWPSWLYIPGKADWKPHWSVPPDDGHRYLYAWTPPTVPGGYNKASRDDGTLYAHQRW